MPQQSAVKYPDFVDFQSRLDSFAGWQQSDIITPVNLATAGFFFTGQNDSVKCFSCGGGIRNWEHGDDPWILHAESFTWCNFVTVEKGLEFIAEHGRVYSDLDGPAEPDQDENAENDVFVECKVCKEKNSNTVLMPCCHLACCETCAPQITHCVVCEALITERVRAYMS